MVPAFLEEYDAIKFHPIQYFIQNFVSYFPVQMDIHGKNL
jgi:hypothetical protein